MAQPPTRKRRRQCQKGIEVVGGEHHSPPSFLPVAQSGAADTQAAGGSAEPPEPDAKKACKKAKRKTRAQKELGRQFVTDLLNFAGDSD
jgi:hypothetical protein